MPEFNREVVQHRPVCSNCSGPYQRYLTRVRNAVVVLLALIGAAFAAVGVKQVYEREPDGPIALVMALPFVLLLAAHFAIERSRARAAGPNAARHR